MAILVANCPRCGTRHTNFDVKACITLNSQYDWQHRYECFVVCRSCIRGSVVILKIGSIDYGKQFNNPDKVLASNIGLENFFEVTDFVTLKDHTKHNPPEFLPDDLRDAFLEAESCFGINCYNAAATMFRLCIDIATKPMLPEFEEGKPPNRRTRRDLALRLVWLFDNNFLPDSVRELAQCIREDGNDGAHAGNLKRVDAEDILDFTYALLSRLYTEPKKLELAKKRREDRRKSPK